MSIEEIIEYIFINQALLEEALTHPSRALQVNGFAFNYQRLEFLGDSVLSLIVAELLFQLYPHDNEGSLAKRHSALVCSTALASIGSKLNLGKFIHMAPSEHGGGGRENRSNLEDVCEALIGAIYLDGGLDAAKRFVIKHWEPMARAVIEPPKDAKTSLQEWAQARGLPLPVYRVIATVGPSHSPEFTIAASVDGKEPVIAKAHSKRVAEQIAAKGLLDKLNG